MIKFEDLPYTSQLLCYLKMSFEHDQNSVFCTCNKELQKAADELIIGGLVIELDSPGGNDRAFGLTSAGKIYVNISL